MFVNLFPIRGRYVEAGAYYLYVFRIFFSRVANKKIDRLMDLKNVYYKIVVAPLDMLGERKSNLVTIASLPPGKHQIPVCLIPVFNRFGIFSRSYGYFLANM